MRMRTGVNEAWGLCVSICVCPSPVAPYRGRKHPCPAHYLAAHNHAFRPVCSPFRQHRPPAALPLSVSLLWPPCGWPHGHASYSSNTRVHSTTALGFGFRLVESAPILNAAAQRLAPPGSQRCRSGRRSPPVQDEGGAETSGGKGLGTKVSTPHHTTNKGKQASPWLRLSSQPLAAAAPNP